MNREDIIRGLTEIRDPDFLFVKQYVADAGRDLILEPESSRLLLEERANHGAPEAQFALAKVLFTGLAGAADQSAAFKWCQRSAESGYAPARVMLSGFYAEGWGGVSRDKALALSLLKQGAGAGFSHAMVLLGVAYLEGVHVEKDREQGLHFLEQAAELGDPSGQCMFGRELLESQVPTKVAAGLRWIIAAAEQGFPSAHRELAHLYQEGGGGLPKDDHRAAHHREKAEALENEK